MDSYKKIEFFVNIIIMKMSRNLRYGESYSKLYYVINQLIECKDAKMYEFIDANQDVLLKDKDVHIICGTLINHLLPVYGNGHGLGLDEFYKSDYYNVLKILFSQKFAHYINVRLLMVKVAQQRHSDVILDLFMQNRDCITSDFINLIHGCGSYDMIKLIIEKYKKEPMYHLIKTCIYGELMQISISRYVRKYYVEHYLKDINDDAFLYHAWRYCYSNPDIDLRETREIFMCNLLHRENLRNITDDWLYWNCYIKYMKRIVLTVLKRHRVNYTLIGELNDVGQLCRIINGFL